MAKKALISSFVFLWLFLSGMTFSTWAQGVISLPQTGQTKCYNSAGTEIDCAGTGQEGEWEMGVEWPEPRFANPDGTVPITGGVVVDQLTGLMWARDAGTPTVGACAGGTKTWEQALAYVACLRSSNYLGYDNWRLPNVNELESLFNAGEANSATWLNSKGFNNVQSYRYWSSTTNASSTNNKWVVELGGVDSYYRFSYYYVWPVYSGQSNSPDPSYPANIWKTGQTTGYVDWDDGDLERGVAWPPNRFTDHGNGTVTDNLTGLMWSKNANLAGGTKTWQEALDFVKTLNTGGFSDWRLPNRKELFSLIDFSQYSPALQANHPFQNMWSNYYWSSTTDTSKTAWVVYMLNGRVIPNVHKVAKYSVWPVRSGQTSFNYPDISIVPNPLPFGKVNIGGTSDKIVTIRNDGTANLVIGAITNPSLPFSKIADYCSGQTIVPNGACTVTYRFAPTSAGTFSSNSNIPSNDPDENPVTIILSGSGTTSLSSIKGSVIDTSGGSPLSGVLIQVNDHSAITNVSGEYTISDMASGTYTLTASKDGYYTHTESLIVPPNTSLKINIKMTRRIVLEEIKLLSVSSKYRGFVYYLDGVDHFVTYTANIDWGGHPPGFVEFRAPKGTFNVSTGGLTASRTFNMGRDFGPCGRLELVAESNDETRSKKLIADFVVMSKPYILWSLRSRDIGDGFLYTWDTGINIEFFEEGVDAGLIPKNIPLFGDSPFKLDFIPQIGQEISSQGELQLTFQWEDLEAGEILSRNWGREHNLRKIIDLLTDFIEEGRVDRRRLPKAGIASFEIYLYPILNIEGQFDPAHCNWDIGGYVGIVGGLELKKTWPFIFMAGPIPVPMYVKASIEMSADVQVGVTGLPPQENLNGRFHLQPYARGSLGAGVDNVFSVEGWIGGGGNLGLQFPELPHLEELTLYLNGGVTITAFLWKWESELLRWDWEYVKSVQGMSALEKSPLGLEENRVPVTMPRDYILRPGYGRFVRRPALKVSTVETNGERYTIAAGAIQSTVFPYSKPSLSSSGENLYLTYLYDDSNRSSMNRTVAVFSSWNGVEWSEPAPIWDDGTADFSPQILASSDGSAIAAWEDVRSVLPETATFEEMVAALEISVAKYDPITNQWSSPLRLTSNGYLDRTPRLAGVSPDNVMLTWIRNEGNDLRGSASEPNSLWYSIWNGTEWSQPQIAAQVANGIVKTSTAYHGKRAYITMSIDTDDKAETIEDHDLFSIAYDSGTWGPVVQLTNDTTQDDNPQLGIDPDGHFILSWVKGNDLVTSVDFDISNRETITTNEYSSSFADFKMATGGSGRLAILWAEASENDSDIYAVFYDPIFQAWGNPKQLTFDQATERDLVAAFYGEDTLIAVYNRVQMGTSKVTRTTPSGQTVTFSIPRPGETDLYMLRYVIGGDLGLKSGSLMIDPLNPPPGTEVTLSVTAANLGETSASSIPVAFYWGNPAEGGTEIGRTSVTNVLNPGDEVTVTLNWVVPETTESLNIYAIIDPNQEIEDRDRTNNVTNDRFIKPDLSIQSASWFAVGENLVSITARIRNEGAVTSPATDVVFRLGAIDGPVVSTADLQSLERDSAADVDFLWDVTGLPTPFERIIIIVDESKAVDNFDRANNSVAVLVNLFRPEITVVPATVNFGNVLVDSLSDRVVKIRNDGTADLTLGAIGTPLPPFSRAGGSCTDGQVLIPGEECSIIVRFAPTTAEAFISGFSIFSDDPDENLLTINLSGTGVAPDITVSSTDVNFGKVLKGSYSDQTITIQNDGSAPLTITEIGSPSAPFSITGRTCGGGTVLNPGEGCTITIRFAPTLIGSLNSSFEISSNDPDENPVSIGLSGTGVIPDIAVDTTNLDFGKVLKGNTKDLTVTVRNEGTAPLSILGIGTPAAPFAIAGGTCGAGEILAAEGGACTIIVRFTPAAQGPASSSFNIISDDPDPDEGIVTISLTGQGVLFFVDPSEGTIGSEVTITGTGFGEKKGKVVIGQAALKVINWNNETIHASLSKVMAPDTPYDVVVTPKEPKGAEPITEPEAFTMKRPEITSVEPGSGTSGSATPIKIKGKLFGNKKGKVTLEKAGVVKSCKVLSWTMVAKTGDSEIQFLVPKGLVPGDDYVLGVTNKVGFDTAPFRIIP